MATDIPVTASLQGQPNLREMVVSASWIHRVVKSKNLELLAKQVHRERNRVWAKRQLSKQFPPPPSKPPTSFPPPPQSPESPLVAEPGPEEKQPGLGEEDSGMDMEEGEDLVEPKPMKFRRIGDEHKVIQQSGESTGLVQTLGWGEEFEPIRPASGEGSEDNKVPLDEVPTLTPVDLPAPSQLLETAEVPSPDMSPLTPVALPAPPQLLETASSLVMSPPVTAAVNQKPLQLDLSTITPKPVYVPEEQPAHLKPVDVQKKEKEALEFYQEVQKDVKEVTKGSGELKDQEGIISARPDGRVTLEDGQKGLIEVKSPTSAKRISVSEAVRKKRIKFLLQSEEAGQTKFKLKRTDNYYHQVQAEIYAGDHQGYCFCDFVVYLEETEDGISIERIQPDSKWQDKNVPKVREFCDIYNKLLVEETQQGDSESMDHDGES